MAVGMGSTKVKEKIVQTEKDRGTEEEDKCM